MLLLVQVCGALKYTYVSYNYEKLKNWCKEDPYSKSRNCIKKAKERCTRKYLLKHHKLGPVKAFVTVETYRPELGQD